MQMNLRFSVLLIVLLSHLRKLLPSAMFDDFPFNFGSINMPSQYGRCAGSDCRCCPGIPNFQNVCGPTPSMVNPENLALPLRTCVLPAGPLKSSLQFPEKVQAQQLEKMGRVRGKPDHLDIVLRVQS
jgi:hypothetical protein